MSDVKLKKRVTPSSSPLLTIPVLLQQTDLRDVPINEDEIRCYSINPTIDIAGASAVMLKMLGHDSPL